MVGLWVRWKHALATATPALLAIAVVVALFEVPLFQGLESASYDLRLRFEARARPMPAIHDVVVIAIDNNSQSLVGRWPWPRQIWADVVDRLAELGAHAVFFDITFPEPVTEVFQTREGRLPLTVAIQNSIQLAEETIKVASQQDARLTTAVPPLLADGFRELRSRMAAILPRPDRVVAESLIRAQQGGMLTGGVATVSRERLAERELAALAADPTRPATGTLSLWRDAFALFRDEDSPELVSGVAPALREFAMENMHDIRRFVVGAHAQRVLGGAPLGQVDVDALFAKLPASYQESRVGRTLFEQALSDRLVAARFLVDVAGRERLALRSGNAMLLPTFSLARGYDFLGADNELKDADGSFRAVPLLWEREGRVLPAGGLALFLRVLAAGGKLPELKVAPGPVLEIAPAGRAPVRVPVNAQGDLLVHWSGAFATSLNIVPAGTLINLSGHLRDREEFLAKQSRNGVFELAVKLRERAGELLIRSPEQELSLDELLAQVFDGPPTAAFGIEIEHSKVATRPADAKEKRRPAAWLAFAKDFLAEREASLLSVFKMWIAGIEKETDPAKRAVKEKKYAKLLAPYYRFVHKADGLRKDLAERVRGKICLIGHTADSSTDMGTIPFDQKFPKVGSYANVYNTLATERFLYRPSWLTWGQLKLQLPLLITVCFALALILPHLSSWRGFQWAFAFCVAWTLGATALFVLAGVWVDVVAPVLGASLTYIIVVTQRNRRTEKVRSMFETYVDPRIVKVVVEDESRWRELGGVETRITAFFSDIANFTTLSEMLSPQEVSQMLTDYLSPMTDIILAHDGTRDKYIGDAIVAFFGAPLPTEGHELQACLASIEQQERALELKKKWREDGATWYAKLLAAGTDLTFRIGLNSGLAKVGNFGSLNSKNYTMIGDSVNLASRLEGANKEYGTLIMASEATVSACGGKIVTRELDRLVVKGRKEAVRVFDVIGRTGQVAPHWAELLERYERALADYYRREFAKARAGFGEVLARWPEDGPSRVYVARCEAYEQEPPAEDWDGSYKMTHK